MAYFEPPWRKRRRMRETVPSHEQPWTATSPGLPTEDEVARKYLDYYAETGSDPLYDKSAGANNLPMAARYATLGRSSLPASYLPAEEQERGLINPPPPGSMIEAHWSREIARGTQGVAEWIKNYGKTVQEMEKLRDIYPWATDKELQDELFLREAQKRLVDEAVDVVSDEFVTARLPESAADRAQEWTERAGSAIRPPAPVTPKEYLLWSARSVKDTHGPEAAKEFVSRVRRSIEWKRVALKASAAGGGGGSAFGALVKKMGSLLAKLPSPSPATGFAFSVMDTPMKEDEEYMPPPRGYEVLEKKKRGGK